MNRPRAMRILAAVVLIGIGLVWIGQGLGFVPGSFMSGDPFWAVMGAAAVVVGVIVGWLSLRRDPHA